METTHLHHRPVAPATAEAHDTAAQRADTTGSAAGLTRTAFFATLHCLLGCAVGEVAGMVVGTALGWGSASTMGLAVALAFLFGYAFTFFPLRRAGMTRQAAARVALAADTASIAIMEIVDNAVMLLVPGAMDATLDTLLFWGALASSLAAALLAAWPLNRWLLARGRGHALAHAHHGHRPARHPAAVHAPAASATGLGDRRSQASASASCGTQHPHAMHG